MHNYRTVKAGFLQLNSKNFAKFPINLNDLVYNIMPFQNDEHSFFGNALIGACCAIGASVPLSAYIASFIGDSYEIRVWVYGLTLLWVISGAITIFFKTYRSEKKALSVRFMFLWFLSVWLWPLLLVFGHKRD